MTKKHLTNQRFTEFTLEESLQQGLRDAGFEYCTPIQAACLPSALEGKDVAGQAQTGTGKTVAFLLACGHYLLTHPPQAGRKPTQPQALILAPTRELAIQIYRDAEVLLRHTGFTLGLVYGGTGYEEQKVMLAEGVDILIGTPGRLIDFSRQDLYDLKRAQVAVLDEADRMFDLGFIRDIRFLLRRMPAAESRLNLLFSATLSFKVMELAYEHMNNPEEITIEGDAVVIDMITEYSYYPADEEKLPLLVNLLKRDNHERILVFVNTRHGVEKVANVLSANDISNGALSGDVPQRKREQLLDSFKRGDRKVLVATDVAARGLHIPDVTQVYNYDLPQDADDYIHRIGRTARAGASGEAISFVCERYAYSIMDIEQSIGHALPRREINAELLQNIQRAATAPRSRKGAGNPERSRTRKPPTNQRAVSVAEVAKVAKVAKVVEIENKDPARAQEEVQPQTQPKAQPQAQPEVRPEAQTEPLNRALRPEPIPESVAPRSQSESVPESIPQNIPAIVVDESSMPSRQRFSRRYGEVPVIG